MNNSRTSKLMNYGLNSSNSNNYISLNLSSSPESFPNLMENGIIVEYKKNDYASEIVIDEKEKSNHNDDDSRK